MKRILTLATLALVIVLGSSFFNKASSQYDYPDDPQYDQGYGQDRDVSYQTFYDELSPYGRWVDYPGQGYVWVPDAGNDFRPYSTNGHWVWTDNYEWMWVSEYDWGWAPFHYGRWDQDPYYGWYWVPGYEWSPAWVAWRDGGDYYGWAPIRPGISININFNIGGYSPPVDFWCFTPRRYITSPRVYDYYIDRRQNITIINYTTIISNNFHYSNNYGFRSGPRRYDAERFVGRINPVRFRESYNPGRSQFRNNEISVYRPNVRRENNRNYAPRSVERYDRSTSNSGFRNRSDNRTVSTNQQGNRMERTDGRTGNADTRRFERRENTNQPNEYPRTRTNETQTPNNNPNRGNNDRRFERTENRPTVTPGDNRTNYPGQQRADQPQRQFERRQNDQPVERRQQPVQQQPTYERRQVSPPAERRQEPVQQQQPQRQFERRQNDQPVERRQQPVQQQPTYERRQASPQAERREQPVQQQQPQRQFERRESGSNPGGNGGGNGNGRRRF